MVPKTGTAKNNFNGQFQERTYTDTPVVALVKVVRHVIIAS
jgi:hypothetical protein